MYARSTPRGYAVGIAWSTYPTPPGAVTPPPVATAAPARVQPSADPFGQIDLLTWRPRPAKPLPTPGSQLDLF